MVEGDKDVQLKSDLEQSGGWGFRFSWVEFSGSLGDLGLFLPLVAAMTIALDLNIGMILICAGAMNILAGFLFRQPVPVQPMKAIAIVVITENLARDELVAAGLLMGVLMLVLSGFVTKIIRIIPKAVVRGIQLGVGLKLAAKGANEIGALAFVGWDSMLIAIGVTGFLLVMLSRSKPVLLYVFMVGFLLQYFEMGSDYPAVGFSLPEFGWYWPGVAAWKNGFINGALPQLPLTLLNSVIAVCALSEDFFPGRGISPRKMSVSVGVMNLICVPLGGIPMCHGAGGLAAQYHFGARTGGS
ncbi:MAG: sulfate transporter, partial [Planctomycetes bacterium]|nr:sulfate transporter [Planctomycetota bacterium]